MEGFKSNQKGETKMAKEKVKKVYMVHIGVGEMDYNYAVKARSLLEAQKICMDELVSISSYVMTKKEMKEFELRDSDVTETPYLFESGS